MENCEHNEHVEKRESCGCGCDCATAEVDKVEVAHTAAPRRAYIPAVDIIDGETETVLVTDMAGVDENGIDITIEKSVLTVKGKPAEQSFEGKKLIYSEYGVGDYQRTFHLSEDVNREGVSASIKNGVLRIRLPKSAPAAKKIAVAAE